VVVYNYQVFKKIAITTTIVNQKHAFDFLQPRFSTLIPGMIPEVMQFLILAHSVLKPEKKTTHTHTHTHTHKQYHTVKGQGWSPPKKPAQKAQQGVAKYVQPGALGYT